MGRIAGVLTSAERHLMAAHAGDKGRDLLKQVWTHLAEMPRGATGGLIFEVTTDGIVTSHHGLGFHAGQFADRRIENAQIHGLNY